MAKRNYLFQALAIIALLLLVIGIPRVTVLPATAPGFVPHGGEARECVGVNTESGGWGYGARSCPAGYAFYGLDDPGGIRYPGARIEVAMNCCPLPAADILTEEHFFELEQCPADTVATGSRRDSGSETIALRCTKINTARYQLGAPRKSVYWGEGYAGWWGAERIRWENIPSGIRLAQGREREDKWDVDGCVGYPWGSLLVEKRSKYCSGFFFRQLQFAGAAGDPPRGSPVKMFPDR